MAYRPLFGQLASVTAPSTMGVLFNAASLTITQGVATALPAFGGTWVAKNGTVCQYSGSISGTMAAGDSTHQTSLTPLTTRAGVSLTISFDATQGKVCSFADTVILSAMGMSTTIETAGQQSFSFEGPSSFSGPTLTWDDGEA